MKRIGITSNPSFPLDEWSVQTIDFSELFQIPERLTMKEKEFAQTVMETFNMETDDDEALIEMVLRPSDFKSLIVTIQRMNEEYNKQSNSC